MIEATQSHRLLEREFPFKFLTVQVLRGTLTLLPTFWLWISIRLLAKTSSSLPLFPCVPLSLLPGGWWRGRWRAFLLLAAVMRGSWKSRTRRIPNRIGSLQPPHVKAPFESTAFKPPRREMSQSQVLIRPRLQARVTAWTAPAAQAAVTNAVSRVPLRK